MGRGFDETQDAEHPSRHVLGHSLELAPGRAGWTHIAFEQPGVAFCIQKNIEPEQLKAICHLFDFGGSEGFHTDLANLLPQQVSVDPSLLIQKLGEITVEDDRLIRGNLLQLGILPVGAVVCQVAPIVIDCVQLVVLRREAEVALFVYVDFKWAIGLDKHPKTNVKLPPQSAFQIRVGIELFEAQALQNPYVLDILLDKFHPIAQVSDLSQAVH